MPYIIRSSILKIYNFIGSLNFGTYFVVSVAAIIFSCSMLYSIFVHKNFGKKSNLKKIIFIPTLLISVVFILNMTLAGDISPNLSAEKMARLFAEALCSGRIEEVSKDNFIAPNYHDTFTLEWNQKYKDLNDIQCEADNFTMTEYHYKYENVSNIESCVVVLQTSHILNLPKSIDETELCDFDFKIHLTKIAIASRFLGKYVRWRIIDFSYVKSETYIMKEWLDNIEKKLKSEY
jgi:hypothetical protein